jgi:hypothetical protein
MRLGLGGYIIIRRIGARILIGLWYMIRRSRCVRRHVYEDREERI